MEKVELNSVIDVNPSTTGYLMIQLTVHDVLLNFGMDQIQSIELINLRRNILQLSATSLLMDQLET